MTQFKIKPYMQLMRIDKPEGSLLLLWPTLWGLWVASNGMPELHLLIIFTSGVFIMRAAGCVINDIADMKFDKHVLRTKNRPLARGAVKRKNAFIAFSILCCLALFLVLQLNHLSILLSLVGLALTMFYPFCKRFTNWPQVVLGAAFNWGIILAFTATQAKIPPIAWFIYTLGMIWTVAYDTIYAMVDYQDDIKIGVKSSAIGLGDMLIPGITVLYTLLVVGFGLLGLQLSANPLFYVALLPMIALIGLQLRLIQTRDPIHCFRAFKLNNWLGLLVILALNVA